MKNPNKKPVKRALLQGNEAIGLAMLEGGCQVFASYPGTPSSEILPASVNFAKKYGIDLHTEWSANEKIAFEVALAASYTGQRAAVAMKQVGLNVAADPLMSSAYIGVIGGFIIVTADDPGPHSSQTEQDSRFWGPFAKLPVYDPSCPQEARDMVLAGFELSEQSEIPVILRPVLRVCHSRGGVEYHVPVNQKRSTVFNKNPQRWAATPRFRFQLHKELNIKNREIREIFEGEERFNQEYGGQGTIGIISGGYSFSVLMDLLDEAGLSIPVLRIGTPFPLPLKRVERFIDRFDKVLVIEETYPVIENQIIDKSRLLGRNTGTVPSEGELTPDTMVEILQAAGVLKDEKALRVFARTEATDPQIAIRRPSLCAGCPHRAAFFAMTRAFPDAIFPSDIGCYTLGLNLSAVDTVLDMGASINMAAGFYWAYKIQGKQIPVIATIGDSTFYHSGPSALLSQVYNDARLVLVILDNAITAMTGHQPTPGTGIAADRQQVKQVPLEELVKGCGVTWCKTIDPYHIDELIDLLKQADDYTRQPDGGIAVIIARHP
ncbi:thiamine pyrophosphate-dependent enzyme, partial [Acidobacteriota bacterium]